MTYLGIDLGTSGIKALLIDQNQSILATGHADLDVSRPNAGWSEQNPADWIKGVEICITQLRKQNATALSALTGIGLSGHMHGATLVGADGNPLRPCIMWNDTRSHEEAAILDRDPDFREISGNIVFPGFTAPKTLWMRNNEPDTFAKIHKALLPKDYLRFWLTGEYASEMSDAAGTSWLDVASRSWSSILLEKSEMRPEQMPSLVEGTAVSGMLRRDLSARWGLENAVVVGGGAGDNAASAIGMGAISTGDSFLSLGTSGVLFVVNDQFRPNPQSAVHAFCHALPGTWHQMGVILSATDALNWLAGVTGTSSSQLDATLPAKVSTPSGLTFLPYLSGERTPHNDAGIRGAIYGLHHGADPKHLTQAVMEGVSFAFADCLAALEAAGTDLERVLAVGGGSRSGYWLQLLATILDVEIEVPEDGEFGAAFGAARIGLIASDKAEPAAVCTKPTITKTYLPDRALISAYQDALQNYRQLYPAIKNLNM